MHDERPGRGVTWASIGKQKSAAFGGERDRVDVLRTDLINHQNRYALYTEFIVVSLARSNLYYARIIRIYIYKYIDYRYNTKRTRVCCANEITRGAA